MDVELALELSAVAGLILALVHLLGPRARRRYLARVEVWGPLSAGAITAYVFLQMLPSLDEGVDDLGLVVSVAVLVGFVAFYGAEHVLAERPPRHLFAVRIAIGWLYSFLIVATMPALLEQRPAAAGVSIVAVALHVLQADNRLALADDEAFEAWGRYVLATGPLAAVIVDVVVAEPSPDVAALLAAFVSGSLLLNIFRDELGGQRLASFPLFLAGVGTYGGLVALEHVLA